MSVLQGVRGVHGWRKQYTHTLAHTRCAGPKVINQHASTRPAGHGLPPGETAQVCGSVPRRCPCVGINSVDGTGGGRKRGSVKPGPPHHLEATGELWLELVGGATGLQVVKSQAPGPSLWVNCSEHDRLQVMEWGSRVGSCPAPDQAD